MSQEKVVVYKIQEVEMGEGEKKYSQLGNLEAHYYFAKNNNGKVLFTTKSNLFKEEDKSNFSGFLLLTIPDGSYGFIARVIQKGTYPDEPSSDFKVPCQWNKINISEKMNGYNWIALELVEKSSLRKNIPHIPRYYSPQYMLLEDVLSSSLAK